MSTPSSHPPLSRRAITLLTSLAAFFPFLRSASAASADSLPAKPTKAAVETLRDKHWLRSLPDTITVPVASGEGLFITKRLIDASVDDVSFAASAMNRDASAVLRIAMDLRSVHDLARQAGAVGTANAIAAAISAKDARR